MCYKGTCEIRIFLQVRDVEARSFVCREINDESELLYDVTSKDDVVGAMFAVVENN